jgi:hypothetical protein
LFDTEMSVFNNIAIKRRTGKFKKAAPNASGRSQSPSKMKLDDIEKDRKLVIVLHRLTKRDWKGFKMSELAISGVQNIHDHDPVGDCDDDINWKPASTSAFRQELQETINANSMNESVAPPVTGSPGLRKSQRKRKPTSKVAATIHEDAEDEQEHSLRSKKQRKSNVEQIDVKEESNQQEGEVSEPEQMWGLETEYSDDEDADFENDLAPPIKLLQYSGKRKKVGRHYCKQCDRNFAREFSLDIHRKKRHEGNHKKCNEFLKILPIMNI